MRFDYNEYYKILLIASICIMLLSLIIITVQSILFFKNNTFQKKRQAFIGHLSSVALSILLFTIGLLPFRHGIYLFKEKENDKIECFGEINSFEKAYGNNKYVYNNKTVFAQYIIIDGEKFYIMYTGDLEIGDEVTFEYLPKSRIILSIYKYNVE